MAIRMNPIELTKRVDAPHTYWSQKYGFPEGVGSYKEFRTAMSWFQDNSATFSHVAFRGEPKYYESYCKPNIARDGKKFTRHQTGDNIITDQEIKSALLSSGNHNGNNIFFNTQHYGGHTRLLDVTTSQEVALFFACESNFDEDGYIYIFFGSTMLCMWAPITNSLDSAIKYYNFMKRNDVCYLLESYQDKPERMVSQHGAFLSWKEITDHIPSPLYTIKIKHSSKKQILREIYKLGWTAESLFPDLYGNWLSRNLQNG